MSRYRAGLTVALFIGACTTGKQDEAPLSGGVLGESAVRVSVQTGYRHGPPDSALFRQAPVNHPLISWMVANLRPLRVDTPFFYSRELDATWAYRGFPVDTIYYPLFQAQYPDLDLSRWVDPSVFASTQIALDDGLTGFTIRGSGKYSVSAVDLWVYDSIQGRILQVVQVAETSSDEGDVIEHIGWLFDADGDGSRDIVQRLIGTTYDPSEDPAPPLVFRDSLWLHSGTQAGVFDTAPRPVSARVATLLDPARWLRKQ